jgi:hypothetical protein
VQGVLAAEAAELVQLDSVRVILFVFHRVIISLLAFRAGKGNFDSHVRHLFLS